MLWDLCHQLEYQYWVVCHSCHGQICSVGSSAETSVRICTEERITKACWLKSWCNDVFTEHCMVPPTTLSLSKQWWGRTHDFAELTNYVCKGSAGHPATESLQPSLSLWWCGARTLSRGWAPRGGTFLDSPPIYTSWKSERLCMYTLFGTL